METGSEISELLRTWLPLVLGFVGTLLGIVNLWLNYTDRKTRLELELSQSLLVPSYGSQNYFLTINVINKSSHSVEIHEVGFMLWKHERLVILPQQLLNFSASLPKVLEPRRSANFCFYDPFQDDVNHTYDLKCVYVRSATGELFIGAKKNTKKLVKSHRNQRAA